MRHGFVRQLEKVCLWASRSKVDIDKPLEAVKVLRVEFNVVVPGAFNPQRRKNARTAFVDSQAVREVNHFVLRAMNHEHRRIDARHFAVADNTHTTRHVYKIPTNQPTRACWQ